MSLLPPAPVPPAAPVPAETVAAVNGYGVSVAAPAVEKAQAAPAAQAAHFAELKAQLESDPRPRYFVHKGGMDHGPFTAVELVRAARLERAVPFTNAVMRRLAHGLNGLVASLPEGPVKQSYPDWIAETWTRDFGAETALALMRAQNEPPALEVRADAPVGYPTDVPGAYQVDTVDISRMRPMSRSSSDAAHRRPPERPTADDTHRGRCLADRRAT